MQVLFASDGYRPSRHCARSPGFTLIETLVVIAISAILIAMATPSMRSLIERNGVADSVNSFLGAINFARAESLKRGVSVSMCRSTDAESASAPSCSKGVDWASGWIVYADIDGDDNFDASRGDLLLRAQGSLAKSGSITQNTAGFPSLEFSATGLLTNGMSSFVFCSPSQDPDARRKAIMNKTGRARVSAERTDACG